MASVKRGADEAPEPAKPDAAPPEPAPPAPSALPAESVVDVDAVFAAAVESIKAAADSAVARLSKRVDELEQRVVGRLDESARGLRAVERHLERGTGQPSTETNRRVEVRLADDRRVRGGRQIERRELVVAGLLIKKAPRVFSVTERKLEQLRAEPRIVVTPVED